MLEGYKLEWARESLHPSLPPSSHHHHTHLPPTSTAPPEVSDDETWNSESEEGDNDTPDGPLGNFRPPGGCGLTPGGLNLRQAMAQAKVAPITNGKSEVKGQTIEPHPQPGVYSKIDHDVSSFSDWDDDEEGHPQNVDSAHIQAVGGASRELSGMQRERGGEGVRVGGGEGEVVGGGVGVEDEAILSAESDAELPMFGGDDAPSITTPHTPALQLPPISQGHTPRKTDTLSLSPTSPTIVTPLSGDPHTQWRMSLIYTGMLPLSTSVSTVLPHMHCVPEHPPITH